MSFIDNDEDNLIELIISTLRKVAFPNLDFALLVFLLAGSYFLLVVLKRNNKTERSLSCLWLDLSSSRGTTRGALPRKLPTWIHSKIHPSNLFPVVVTKRPPRRSRPQTRKKFPSRFILFFFSFVGEEKISNYPSTHLFTSIE